VFHANSVIGPERYANSVPGAKQKLGLKKYAISVIYAISVKAPEDYANSVTMAKKTGQGPTWHTPIGQIIGRLTTLLA
jgi:hypothetical protein